MLSFKVSALECVFIEKNHKAIETPLFEKKRKISRKSIEEERGVLHSGRAHASQPRDHGFKSCRVLGSLS